MDMDKRGVKIWGWVARSWEEGRKGGGWEKSVILSTIKSNLKKENMAWISY